MFLKISNSISRSKKMKATNKSRFFDRNKMEGAINDYANKSLFNKTRLVQTSFKDFVLMMISF
jgi:hypothetical protein